MAIVRVPKVNNYTIMSNHHLTDPMIFRSQVRKVLPEALTVKYEGGKKSFEDLSEEIHNEKELRKLMEESTERAIRYAEEQRRIQQEQQRRQQQQKGAL